MPVSSCPFSKLRIHCLFPVGLGSYRHTNQSSGKEEEPHPHLALCIFHEKWVINSHHGAVFPS